MRGSGASATRTGSSCRATGTCEDLGNEGSLIEISKLMRRLAGRILPPNRPMRCMRDGSGAIILLVAFASPAGIVKIMSDDITENLLTARRMSARASAGSKSKARPKSKGGRPTQTEVKERHERVLRVASRLFIEQGYEATSLDVISRESGVAKRTLYNDYGGKGGIFHDVIMDRTLLFGSAVQFTVKKNESVTRTLARAAHAVIEMNLSKDTMALTRLIIADAPRFPELMKKVVGDGNANLVNQIEKLLRTLAERGSLTLRSGWSWPLLAKTFVDLMVGNSVTHVATGITNTTPDDAEINTKIKLFLGAMSVSER